MRFPRDAYVWRNSSDPTDDRPWQVWVTDPGASGGWRLLAKYRRKADAEDRALAYLVPRR